MAGDVKLTLSYESVEIENYRRSKRLFEFLQRLDADVGEGKPVKITAGDAHWLLRRLREVKSSLAPRLGQLIKQLKDRREKAKTVASLQMRAHDKHGNFLPRGCFVKCTFKQACLANEILFGVYEGVNDHGTATVQAALRIQRVRLEGHTEKGYVRLPRPHPSIGHVDWDDIVYEPCNNLNELKRRYQVRDSDGKNGRGTSVIPPNPETSGMRRRKKKERKRTAMIKG